MQRHVIYVFMQTIEEGNMVVMGVSQDWFRMPLCIDGSVPCLTGGSDMVLISRDVGRDHASFRHLLPIENLSLQGAVNR